MAFPCSPVCGDTRGRHFIAPGRLRSRFTPHYEKLLQLLRSTREAHDVSQAAVGQRMGMGGLDVSRIETDVRGVDPVEVWFYLRALDEPFVPWMERFDEEMKRLPLPEEVPATFVPSAPRARKRPASRAR